jgi:hypothetical protein
MNAPAPASTETTTAAPAPDAEIDIMALAAEADAAGLPLGAEPDASTPPAAQPPAKASDKATTPKPGEQGAKKTEEKTDPAADGKKDEGKPESKYAQAKKDAERLDRSWQAFNKEKTEFRAERETLRSELETLRREVTQMRKAPAQSGPVRDAHGATAEDYDKLAKRYETEGNDEMAEAAKGRAEALRKQAPTPAAAPADPSTTPEFRSQWERNVEELIKTDAALADPQSPVVQTANHLCSDPTWGRFFKAHPDGIRAAVEVARLMQTNSAAQKTVQELKATQDQLKTAQAEVDRLNSLLQPRGSLPAGPARGEKSITEMSDAEAHAAIHAMAAAADRGEL